MASNQQDYLGSLAQSFVTFATAYQISASPGQNFENAIMYVGSGEAIATSGTLGAYFPALSGLAPATGSLYTLNGQNYATQTGGALLAWATEFFSGNNNLSNLYVAVYDDSSTIGGTVFPAAAITALTTQYTATKMLAYFKMISNGTSGNFSNVAAQLALAQLCQTDVGLLSQAWIPSNDANLLTMGGSTIAAQCKNNGYDAVVIYDANTISVGTGSVQISGPMIQLGLSLGYMNSSGTSVGNNLDMLQTGLVGPSGSGSTSLNATQIGNLGTINVGYFLYVGNTTGYVCLRGGKTVLNNIAAAQWTTSYIDYMSAVSTATYLAQQNRFKNNTTYQSILNILLQYLNLFAGIGRLTGCTITAPSWAVAQTLSNGQTIIVPNAWQATFNDNIRNVTVNGTLYISAS